MVKPFMSARRPVNDFEFDRLVTNTALSSLEAFLTGVEFPGRY